MECVLLQKCGMFLEAADLQLTSAFDYDGWYLGLTTVEIIGASYVLYTTV